MDDLAPQDRSEIAEYTRGTSLRAVVKGFVGRFLPASIASLFGTVLASATFGSGSLVPLFRILAEWSGFVGLGFGIGLLGLSRWLYPDAKVDGLRSVLAGVLAPLLPLAFLYANALFQTGLGLGIWEGRALFILGGLAAALVMFFPWLTPTPEHMREPSVELVDEDPVQELSGGAS